VSSATSTTASRPRRDRDHDYDHDREEGLYTVAHRAHFVDRDAAAALTAWDAYLAAYPDGRFAPEARYNRALTLVRLGRIDEARVALEPFADGRNHGYRQTEARRLLDALDASDGGR
jgi:TolA-binding protein